MSEWFWVEAVTESEEYATVTFLDDDGQVIKNVTQPWGTPLEAPDVPERDGYTFAGWSSALPQRVPADDMTVYAVWTKNDPESSEPESPEPESKPAEKDTNPATGKAAGVLAVTAAAAAAAAITKITRKKSR